MQALPEQIASGLRRPVRLGVWAAALGSEGRVETSDGPLSGRAVVVAADAVDSMTLTGVGADRMRGLRTWWFAADEPPDPQRLLVVDAAGGPVVNSAVMSTVSPTYAPAGRALVQATTLLPSEADEAAVRRHLDRLWACPPPAGTW